jgi:hypothetical protein
MTRKELVSILPKNAHDVVGAEKIIAIGYPTIAPVMRDLFNLMRVYDSPAADLIAKYFGTLGKYIADDLTKALSKQNCWIRHRILTLTIPSWAASEIEQLKICLGCMATQPDDYDNDILALSIIRKYNLVEDKWIQQWIGFKRERWSTRDKNLKQLENP